MAVGQLTVELIASIGKYVADLGKVTAETEATARRIERSLNGAFDSIKSHALGLAAALGVGFSIKGIQDMVIGALEAEAALGRIATRAGISGEELSKLSLAAKLSHTDLSDLADMTAKLSKALLTSQETGSKQEAVLRALGFTARDTGRLLASPTTALFELSKRINELPEGGTKTAAMMLLLGRGGNAAAAAMEELSKQTSLVATRTNEEIAAAKEFDDKLVKLGISSDNLKTSLANALLPTLNDAIEAFVKVSTGAGSLKDGLDKLTADGSVKEWSRDAALALGTLAEALIALLRIVPAVGNSFKVVALDIKVGFASILAAQTHDIGPLKAALDERNAQLKKTADQYGDIISKGAAFTTALRAQFEEQDKIARGEGAPRQGFAGGSADAVQRRAEAAAARAKAVQDAVRDSNARAGAGAEADPAKKILEGQLKALDALIEEEKHTLSSREEFLQAYFSHGDISISQYYAARNDAIAEGLAFQERAFDEEIAKTNAFIESRQNLLSKGNRKDPGYASAAKDIEDANNTIIDITKRRTIAEQEAARLGIKSWFDHRVASEAYQDSLRGISAELLALQGDAAGAARILTEVANQTKFRELALVKRTGTPEEANAAAQAEKQLRETIRLTVVQAELNDKSREFGIINNQIANSVEHLNLQYQLGATTELEALAKTSDAIKAKINLLVTEANAYAALAQSLGNTTAGKEAQNQADALRLRIEQLMVQADALNKKFRDVFTGPFASFLSDIVTRTKSVKEAFTDMAKSIEKSLVDIAAKNVAEKLFGDTGALGGIPKFFAGIFGGGDPLSGLLGGNKGADVAGGATLSAAGLTLTTAGTGLNAAAIALNAAAASLAASSIGSSAGSLFGGSGGGFGTGSAFGNLDFGGFFASGSPYVPKDMLAVVHKGEAIVPAVQNRGNVVSIADKRAARGGDTYHININVGDNTASPRQIANELSRNLREAQASRR